MRTLPAASTRGVAAAVRGLLALALPLLPLSGSEGPTSKDPTPTSNTVRSRSEKPAARRPVVYSTDLCHPHVDPDDHFDLATLYALPGIDLKGIILDQGADQTQRPGRIPVSQLNRLTGRQVPAVMGLAAKLKSPNDSAGDQAAEFQQGVRLILDTLEAATQPVALVTVGSVRDVVAAYNRQPALCQRKVGMVLCFIGEASKADFQEYNVGLDPRAFVGLMRSGLPVYWVPCFDGGPWQNQGRASFWQARQGDLLGEAPPGLVQYFIYALEKETADPLAFLTEPVDPSRRDRLFAMTRNLWCTAVFATLAGQGIVCEPPAGSEPDRPPPGRAAAPRSTPAPNGVPLTPWTGVTFVNLALEAATSPSPALLFDFEPVEVSITDAGVVRYGPAPTSRQIRRFRVLNAAGYGAGMTAATAALLRRFPTPPSAPRSAAELPAALRLARTGGERAGMGQAGTRIPRSSETAKTPDTP